MIRHGLLLTMTEPPPRMEEEFNAWYDEEHLPERLSIRGFRSARRWVADMPPGEGKYLATYELDSLAVLSSPQYLAFLEKPTPWTRRCLGKAVAFRRWAMEQVQPGASEPHRAARAVLLVLSETPTQGLVMPEALQERHFHDPAGKPAYVALGELASAGLRAAPAFGPGRLARVYRAYR